MATDRPSLASLYGSRTMLVLAALGFCGGLPNTLLTSVVPVWVSKTDWSLRMIGLLALVQWPYALKFLWAPLVDRVRIPLLGRLGPRRSWMVLMQSGVAACALAVAIIGPTEWGPLPFMALLACMALCSATQDIVADAYRAQVLQPQELGAGAGVFVSGYRVAYVLIGAWALLNANSYGWHVCIGAIAALAASGAVATLLAPEPARAGTPEPGLRAAVVEPVRDIARRWGERTLMLALFVLLFKLPDQMGNTMTPPLLLKGLGYSVESIGWVRQGLGFGLTIVGALAGGWMVAKWGIIRCLWIFGGLQALSNAGFWLLAWWFGATTATDAAGAASSVAPQAPVAALIPVIAVENFAGGLVTAGFVAFLMSVCNTKHVATQYALLTGLMAVSGALAGALSGELTTRLDYPAFFAVTIAVGIPGMALIAWMRPPPHAEDFPAIVAGVGSASIAAPCPPR